MFHVEQKETHIEVVDHFLTKETFTIKKTPIKGLLKTHPAPLKNKIQGYYRSDKYISHNSTTPGAFFFIYRLIRGVNFWFKYELMGKKELFSKTLDFGSGDQYFMQQLQRRNHNVVGIDPLKANMSKQVYDSIFDESLDGKNFSCITAWHSLEHVHDLENTITRFHKILDDNGTVIVAVPKYRSFDARLYKSFWAAYDVPRHLWHFDRQSIKKVFSNNGFSFIKSTPLLFDSYYVSLLSERYKKSSFRVFNSIVVGTVSNIIAFFTKEYSSNIFVFKKSKTNI